MYEYRVKVVKVVDGDTVDVDIDLGFDVILKNQRVRLAGIDAPESRTRDLVEKQFGLLAKEVVQDMLSEGLIVLSCTEYDSKGKFGRILGDFIVNDVSLVEYMISEGYGVPYNGQSKEEIEKLHLSNRERLIEEGKITIDE